jgi:hypothetical protein
MIKNPKSTDIIDETIISIVEETGKNIVEESR